MHRILITVGRHTDESLVFFQPHFEFLVWDTRLLASRLQLTWLRYEARLQKTLVLDAPELNRR